MTKIDDIAKQLDALEKVFKSHQHLMSGKVVFVKDNIPNEYLVKILNETKQALAESTKLIAEISGKSVAEHTGHQETMDKFNDEIKIELIPVEEP